MRPASVYASFLTGVGLFLGLFQTLSGQPIASESFDYNTGSIAGQNGGTGWAGAWTGNSGQAVIDTTGDELSFTVTDGGSILGGDRALQVTNNSNTLLTRFFDADLTGDDIFISFLFRWDSGTMENNDFLGLWYDEDSFSNGTSIPNIGLKANGGNGSTTGDFFIRTTSSGGVFSTDLVQGETYFVVGHLYREGASANYNRYALYVNPAYGDDGTPAALFSGDSGLDTINLFGMRSVNFSNGLTITVDELRFGEDWASVVPIPEPGTIIAGGCLVLLLGLFEWRRRSGQAC